MASQFHSERTPFDLVAIGASAGGLRALQFIFENLPREFSVPIAVVQHCPSEGVSLLPTVLQRGCRLRVKHAENGERLRAGFIYVAPPGFHLVIRHRGFAALSDEPKSRHSRPSIDRLFSSAAEQYRERVLALVLSGANADGAEGARLIDASGGLLIAQEGAEFRWMPEAAIATGGVDHTLPLQQIAAATVALCMLPGAAMWMQRAA